MKPEVKEYVNQYVRAVYDFDTNHPKEINLQKGDIIRVTSAVDNNWLCGQLRGQEGNFPSSFVEKLTLPAVQENQKIYGAIENFPALQPGDLEFRKGAIIIGLQSVDENWWSGQIGSKEGIFPLTHVIELEIPASLRDRSKSCHSAEPLFAQALCDSVAQLDEELSFSTGDIITVTEVIDSDWYYGELGSKKGMFLSSCVQLLQDDNSAPSSQQGSFKKESSVSQNKTWNEKSNSQYLQKSYSFDQSYYGSLSSDHKVLPDPVSHVEDSVFNKPFSNSAGHSLDSPQNSESYDSGISVNTNHIAGYSDQSSADNAAYTSENTKSVESSVNPYGVAQFPFAGQSVDELTFEANEIIYLIQHIDEQWTEGEIDGKIGIFPTSFVSIIVDCPYAYSEQGEKEEDISASRKQEEEGRSEKSQVDLNSQTVPPCASGKEEYALVLHEFLGEVEGDLTCRAG
ncbi:hypothetical protein FSP39_019815 [Pinctada imbricata]|uniref:SH3 domain-containing protein n=1 Tax=Pinctada imbricata TaxID=66713 RepID=A0AA89C0K6_PINIB|nr:hypothetical protein FSP39_019815 [Pinctada imbricata]